jgi:hypothetical protein
VSPTASTEELRSAYRALAQRLHPDRQSGATAAERTLADRRMREINEAWDVLRDPQRRRAYDEQRLAAARQHRRPDPRPGPPVRTTAGGAAGGDGDGADLDLVDAGPVVHGLGGAVVRHLPWVAILAVLAVIFVITAYAGTGAEEPPPTTQPLAAGVCVDVAAGPVTTVVDCDGPHDLRVVTRITEVQTCPAGTETRRLGTDGLLDCVAPGSA